MIDNRKKIMLIDDNPIDLKINSKLLSLSNQFNDIVLCQSGDEALSYLRNHIGDQTKLPDLILLDIQMPEMNGFEFLEIYKNLPKEFLNACTIAILSSTLDFADIKRAEANPYVIKLLKKPLETKEVEQLIA
jgi:CheY-like chemotaxis protein